jgi:hypothetical protein
MHGVREKALGKWMWGPVNGGVVLPAPESAMVMELGIVKIEMAKCRGRIE